MNPMSGLIPPAHCKSHQRARIAGEIVAASRPQLPCIPLRKLDKAGRCQTSTRFLYDAPFKTFRTATSSVPKPAIDCQGTTTMHPSDGSNTSLPTAWNCVQAALMKSTSCLAMSGGASPGTLIAGRASASSGPGAPLDCRHRRCTARRGWPGRRSTPRRARAIWLQHRRRGWGPLAGAARLTPAGWGARAAGCIDGSRRPRPAPAGSVEGGTETQRPALPSAHPGPGRRSGVCVLWGRLWTC